MHRLYSSFRKDYLETATGIKTGPHMRSSSFGHLPGTFETFFIDNIFSETEDRLN